MLTREQYDELMEITMAADPYDGAIRNLFTAFLDGLSELAATKAPINGSWGDGQFAAGVGSAGEAPTPEHPYLWVNTTPTPPALELRDGTGALINTMAREIPLARQDHASYVALRPNAAWAVAVADGVILRAEDGEVIQDLDGDGLEQTGWVVLYMHVESRDRVQAGTHVKAGDLIGHPSCEGGVSSGTHLHLARRYNGEWISTDGQVPFNLDGWISQGYGTEYDGVLKHNNESVEAWVGRIPENQISR